MIITAGWVVNHPIQDLAEELALVLSIGVGWVSRSPESRQGRAGTPKSCVHRGEVTASPLGVEDTKVIANAPGSCRLAPGHPIVQAHPIRLKALPTYGVTKAPRLELGSPR
jgi:hypothetical protein